MKKILGVILGLLLSVNAFGQTVIDSTSKPYLDTECNKALYYPLGSLCQDIDDGKLYKGTGAAVAEVFSGISIFPNATGIPVYDSNSSHYMGITTDSNITANRLLKFNIGDAARTVTLSGNPTLDDWFDQAVKAASSPTFANITDSGLTSGRVPYASTAGLLVDSASLSFNGTSLSIGTPLGTVPQKLTVWDGGISIQNTGTLGSTSLTNGVLTGGTSWTQTNDCTLAGDVAAWAFSAGTASVLTQASGTLAILGRANRWYKFVYTVSNVALAPAAIITTAFALASTSLTLTTGTQTTYFLSATTPGAFTISSTLTADQTFTLDALELYEVQGGNLHMGGTIYARDGTAAAPSITFGSETNKGIYSASGKINLSSGGAVIATFEPSYLTIWNNDATLRLKDDVVLTRDGAANILALRNSTAAQSLRVYTSYTSGTSYERLGINTAAGTITFAAETLDAGTDNIDIIFAPAGTGAVKVSSEFNGATVSNQFSNRLSGDLLGISTAPKFINTLLGTPATDAANMIDVSGAGHNGTYKGTWAASQRINKGMGWVLNPNATDNYVDLGDSNDFSFNTGGLTDIAFTIAGVIEVVNTATNQMIFSKLDTTTGSTKREYNLYLGTDETLTMQFYDESVPVQVNRITNAALSVGFHSFTITYDGGGGATAANGITIYVDGAVVASTAANDASYVAMENTTTSFWIGSRVSTGGTPEYFMQGDFTPPLIDKGYVWSAATVNRFHQYMKGIFNL